MDWYSFFDYAAPAAAAGVNYFTQKDAAGDQADALRAGMTQSAQTQRDMYNQARADTAEQRSLFPAVKGNLLNAPNLTASLGAYASELGGLDRPTMGNLDDDPIYQAQKEELLKTLGRRSAAAGKYNSSDADNAITRNVLPFMQDSYGRSVDNYNREASNILSRYGISNDVNRNRYGQILDMAKIGSNAAASAGNNAMSLGSNLGQTYMSGNNALGTTAYNYGQNVSNNVNNTIGSMMGARNNSELMKLLSQGNTNWLNSPGMTNQWAAR